MRDNTLELNPLKREPKKHEFIVFDLEGKSFDDPHLFVMGGIFDGTNYTYYYDLQMLFSALFSPEYAGMRIYAHWGGIYDFLFLAGEITKHADLSAEFILTHSKVLAIFAKSKTGEKWTIVDSSGILPCALEKAGEIFGLGGKDKTNIEKFGKLPKKKQIAYNRRDCELLYSVIEAYQERLNNMGGELKLTISACAMNLFRRRYLAQSLKTNIEYDSYIRMAYRGGRVELFKFHGKNLYYYDINSSYPFSMLNKLPCSLPIFVQNPTAKQIEKYIYNSDYFAVADCSLELYDANIPCIPLHDKELGKMIFPIGCFDGVFCSPELRLLRSHNQGKILNMRGLLVYAADNILAEYVKDMYKKRTDCKTEDDRYIFKLMLNGLYGKFGERPDKQVVVTTNGITKSSAKYTELASELGYMLKEETRWAAHMNPAISAAVTSYARANLWEIMHKIESDGGAIYYCDTDSVITDTELPTSGLLGGLKLEHRIKEYTGVTSKVYKIDTGEEEIVKAKGFRKLSANGFGQIVSGGIISGNSLARFKTQLRHGGQPVTLSYTKSLKAAYNKRIVLGANETRAINK